MHYQPDRCRIVEGGGIKRYGFFQKAVKGNLQEDIEPPTSCNIYTEFGNYVRERGYEIPTIEYTKAQTTKTTVEYALEAVRTRKIGTDAPFLKSEEWAKAKQLVLAKLRPALAGAQLSSEEELVSELKPSKSSGFFGRFYGYPLVSDFIHKARHKSGGVLEYSKHHYATVIHPFIYYAKMKVELVPLAKLLKRKQRMFLMMCKEHVILHKYFFSKQNKRLRLFQEIAHGQTWFYGYVDRFAQELLKHNKVVSEDDEFWDKSFLFGPSVYEIQRQVLISSGELLDNEYDMLQSVIQNCYECITVLPTGDVVLLDGVNPSGKDATTETNCVARCCAEAYMQVLYYKHIEKPLTIYNHKLGTKFLGDDRIAGSADYPEGYFDYYKDNIVSIGVNLKSYNITNGPEGAEFAGFTFARSHWNQNYFVPLYKLEKIWVNLFIDKETTQIIVLSRFMAFAFLMYPHYKEFSRMRPLVISFLQERVQTCPERDTAITFWWDENFIRSAWTGFEGMAGGGISKACPQIQRTFELLEKLEL